MPNSHTAPKPRGGDDALEAHPRSHSGVIARSPAVDRARAAEAALRIGRAHLAVGAWPEALEEFGRARSLDPTLPGVELYVLWARFQTCADVAERAALREEILCESALQLQVAPHLGLSHYVVGALLLDDGSLSKAERALVKAAALDPGNRDAERRLRLVRIRRRRG